MPCAGLKPGETLNNRATKFQGIGFGVVYKNGAPTHDTQYKSVGQETSVAHGDYRVPNRLGVMAHRVDVDELAAAQDAFFHRARIWHHSARGTGRCAAHP